LPSATSEGRKTLKMVWVGGDGGGGDDA